MFLVNSRYPYFSATASSSSEESPGAAYLLPKLRYYFAEFLNWSYPKRLSIFYLTTCVGFRYGHYMLQCLMRFFLETLPITEKT